MVRADRDCSFLIVEGVDDVRFWESRRHSDCELVDGEGKQNVVEAVRRLDTRQVGGVLGIVDEDYDLLMGKDLGSSNLVAVSPHDLECFLLCRTSALDRVLAEFGKQEKIKSFGVREGMDVRTALLERAGVFGELRWARACGLHIDVQAIRIPRFVDESTWEVDRPGLIRHVAAGLEHELRNCIDRLGGVHPWRLVRGRDVLDVLRIGLQRVLGNLRPTVGVKDIARVLRAAADLDGTVVYEEIRSWERANAPYLVLR